MNDSLTFAPPGWRAANWCLAECATGFLSLRASAHTGVAIPRLEGECIDSCPTGREILRFLVVIVTRFHSSGGLPHQRARWFAMTGNRGTARQTPISRTAVPLSEGICFRLYRIYTSAYRIGGNCPLSLVKSPRFTRKLGKIPVYNFPPMW